MGKILNAILNWIDRERSIPECWYEISIAQGDARYFIPGVISMRWQVVNSEIDLEIHCEGNHKYSPEDWRKGIAKISAVYSANGVRRPLVRFDVTDIDLTEVCLSQTAGAQYIIRISGFVV